MQTQSNKQPAGRSTSDPMFIRVSPLLVFQHPHISIFDILCRPLQSVPPRCIVGTVRVQSRSNMQPEGRCTSNPMFIRVSPLLVYLHPHFWHILSPVAKSSASLNMLTPRFLAILPKRHNVAPVLKYIALIKMAAFRFEATHRTRPS